MTENEAIKELSYDNTAYGGKCTEEVRRVAIHALSEIQQYRAIGTVRQVQDFIADWRKYREFGTLEDIEKSMRNVSVLLAEHELLKLYQSIGTIEEFKALKEKNEPKKSTEFHENEVCLDFICPSCKEVVYGQPYKPKYCKHCGQKLDWQ